MKKRIFLTLGLLAAVVLLLALFWPRPGDIGPKPRATLPDGSIVTLEAVTYGSLHEFFFDDASWRSRLGRALPRFLRRFFRGGNSTMTSTGPNSLVLWVTHYNPATDRYANPASTYNLEIADEHGCTTRISSYGTTGGGRPGFVLSSYALDTFPRRAATFKFRVKTRPPGEVKVLAELDVPNPARGPFPVWQPQPLPQVRTNGELTITLKNVRVGRGGGYIIPEVDLRKNGRRVEDWTQSMLGLEDATGNSHYSPLCTNEPAWKLKYDFYRNARATFAASEVWALTNLSAPATQQVHTLTATGAVGGVRFEVLLIGGPGMFVLSNGVPVPPGTSVAPSASASYSTSDTDGSADGRSVTRGGKTIQELTLTRRKAWLLGRAEGFKENQRFLLRGRDERGRTFSAEGSSSIQEYRIVTIDLPDGAQRLDLEFIVHGALHEEFLIAPPRE